MLPMASFATTGIADTQNFPNMNFAEQIKSERQRLGLNQSEAAALLDVSFEALSKWERGLSTPAAIAQEGAMARLKKAKAKK